MLIRVSFKGLNFILFFFKIYIIGAIGSNDKSDIAVDDMSFVAGSSCLNGGEDFPSERYGMLMHYFFK